MRKYFKVYFVKMRNYFKVYFNILSVTKVKNKFRNTISSEIISSYNPIFAEIALYNWQL